MKIVERNIEELIEAEYNPRKLTQDEHSSLKDSLQRFGIVDPVIVNCHDERKDILIGGHQRVKIWKELGNATIPTVELELTRDQERELNVRLNKNVGSWDFDALALEFNQTELEGWGFDSSEIDFFNTDDEQEVEEDDFDMEPPEEPKTEFGRIYQLGKHRLMCGDSTCEKTVARLMDGEKADIVFTDPPYNIDYQGLSGDHEKIKNDKMSDGDFVAFLKASIQNAPIMYVCHSWQYSHLFRQALVENGVKLKALIVWDKVNPAQHLDLYFKQHELIWYSGEFGGNKTVSGDIWEFKREKNTVHPTMKPLGLIAVALKNHQAGIVYDGFGGSGSTLIASEQTGRVCRMMELDPKYCDVIVERYCKLTDQDPEEVFETGVAK